MKFPDQTPGTDPRDLPEYNLGFPIPSYIKMARNCIRLSFKTSSFPQPKSHIGMVLYNLWCLQLKSGQYLLCSGETLSATPLPPLFVKTSLSTSTQNNSPLSAPPVSTACKIIISCPAHDARRSVGLSCPVKKPGDDDMCDSQGRT